METETNSLGTGRIRTVTTFGLRTRTRFGTWNIRTMLQPTKLDQIAREFQLYRLDLLGLSETRLKESGERRLSTGETLLYSGKPPTEDHSSGVGLLLSRGARQCLTSWSPVSDRIITARFATGARALTFVQVYAPTEQAAEDVKNSFYCQLGQALTGVKRSDIVILMGDLNAKVGSSNQNWESVMGTHGLGTMNENGELFADLCVSYDLVIGGTLFPHRNVHKGTWVSPDGRTVNQIDHIAISKRWRTSLLDVRNQRGADANSDHHLVVGALRIKLKSHKRRVPTAHRRFNTARLKDPETAARFIGEYRQTASASTATGAADRWDAARTAMQSAGSSVLGYVNEQRKEWISDDTWRLIAERRQLKNAINAAVDADKPALNRRYAELARKVGRSARADKRRWANEIADLAESAANSNNMRETYRLARRLVGGHPKTDRPIRSSNGDLLTTEGEQLIRWTAYFEHLLNRPSADVPRSPTGPPVSRRFDVREPSLSEVVSAIKRLKNGKAPGADNISSELLRVDANSAAELLHPVIADLWNQESIPSSMTEGLIIKLPKKGDLSLCSNYRGITLLNTINKVLSIILHDRLAGVLEPLLRKEQAGFRPHRSCVEHINTLRIIVEQSVEFKAPLYLLFVDFKQAFDSVDRDMMWKILQSYGIPLKLLNIVMGLYTEARCQVVHRGKLGEWFTVRSGVRQGCVLSPFLFLLVLDWVMRKVNNTKCGISWTMSERLEDLDFADDICLMSQTANDMEQKLRQLVKYGEQVGLKVNVAKTKLMRINVSRPCSFEVGGEPIQEVDSFCYLGSYLTKDGGASTDVDSRIQKARQAFGSLNKVWNSSQLTRNLKLRIFRTNVLSVLLYGCETWKVTSTIEARIQVFVNKCLRRILRVRWPEVITNEELWRVTNFEKVAVTIRRRKWKWIGHTLRKGVGDIARHALQWNPQGCRGRGRPRMSWRRTVDKEANLVGKAWPELSRLAGNRVRWRQFVDDLCSRVEQGNR